jgi:hypothetical protein
VTVNRSELTLLEDCEDDWRGLWEAVWMEPNEPVEQRAALVTGLVRRGLLDVLRVNEWDEVRSAAAPPLPREEAVTVVQNVKNYEAPPEGDVGHFYVLSLTTEGEAAQKACYS